jgi:NAD(P)-dependent dehydrogenase (short-subunit alcohol dehydrogenase family)
MYRKDGIRCNAVMPGATMTNIMANSNLPPDQQPPPRLADFLNLMPGICSADDIAEGIIFLANSQSANGAELVIDKGWTTG